MRGADDDMAAGLPCAGARSQAGPGLGGSGVLALWRAPRAARAANVYERAMRIRFRALAALSVASACLSARRRRASRDGAAHVSRLLRRDDRLGDPPRRAAGADRQKAGDMAAAQRLALVAAMVRRAASEFRGAEQDYMTDDVSGLPAPVPGAHRRCARKGGRGRARRRRPSGVRRRRATARSTRCSRLCRSKTPHPMIYGLLSNDLADPVAPLAERRRHLRLSPDRSVSTRRRRRCSTTRRSCRPPRVEIDRRPDRSDTAGRRQEGGQFRAAALRARAPASRSGCARSSRESRGFGRSPGTPRTTIRTRDLFALPTPIDLYRRDRRQRRNDRRADADGRISSEVGVRRSPIAGRRRRSKSSVPLPDKAKDVKCTRRLDRYERARRSTSAIAGSRARSFTPSEKSRAGAEVCSPDNLCTCSVLRARLVGGAGNLPGRADGHAR